VYIRQKTYHTCPTVLFRHPELIRRIWLSIHMTLSILLFITPVTGQQNTLSRVRFSPFVSLSRPALTAAPFGMKRVKLDSGTGGKVSAACRGTQCGTLGVGIDYLPARSVHRVKWSHDWIVKSGSKRSISWDSSSETSI
jgi:hypothetical protein